MKTHREARLGTPERCPGDPALEGLQTQADPIGERQEAAIAGSDACRSHRRRHLVETPFCGSFLRRTVRGCSFQALSKNRGSRRRLRQVPEDKPPVTCIYCGEPMGPGQPATIVTKTSLDENGDPDFTSQSVEGMAHSECWERERPDVSEET
jgi:hypothetical protein